MSTRSIVKVRLAIAPCLLAAIGMIGHAQTPLEQGVQLMNTEKYAEAQAAFEKAIASAPGDAEAQFQLARSLFEQEKFDEAVTAFEKAIVIDPKQARYQSGLGRGLGEKARLSNIVVKGMIAPRIRTAFEAAVAGDPRNIEYRNDLLQFYVEAPGFLGGSEEKALEQAAEIGKLDKKEGLLSRAHAYQSLEKFDEALKAFQEGMAAYPDERDFALNSVVLLQEQKRFAEASKLLAGILAKNPDSGFALYQTGRNAALSGKGLEEGSKCLLRYLELTPGPDEPKHEHAHVRLGDIYAKLKNPAEAKKHYSEALKLNPKNENAANGLKALG